MSQLDSLIKALTIQQHDALYYAFEQLMPQWIVLPDKKFIGVHIKGLQQLRILEESGVWSYGEIL